jgi:hypothetical protein
MIGCSPSIPVSIHDWSGTVVAWIIFLSGQWLKEIMEYALFAGV